MDAKRIFVLWVRESESERKERQHREEKEWTALRTDKGQIVVDYVEGENALFVHQIEFGRYQVGRWFSVFGGTFAQTCHSRSNSAFPL